AYPDLVRRVAAAGHVVEAHTWSHARLTTLSAGSFSSEIDRADTLIGSLAGVAVRCVRPPYGAIDDGVATRLTEHGLTPMLWNVDPADWTRPGTAAVAGRVIAGLRPGAVVLMHDGGGDRSQTVGALNTILDAIEQRGYAVAPVCGGGGQAPRERPQLRAMGA